MRKKRPYLPDTITISWHIDDVKCVDDSLTDRQCREVLDIVKRTHQADVGVNWEVIQCAIDYYRLQNNI